MQSKFSVSDERNGVSCGSTNISHMESHVVTSAFAVVVSVAFFLLIGSDFSSLHGAFRFTGDPFFRGSLHTEGIAVDFKVHLRPASEGR